MSSSTTYQLPFWSEQACFKAITALYSASRALLPMPIPQARRLLPKSCRIGSSGRLVKLLVIYFISHFCKPHITMCGKCTINIVSLVTLTENFCLKNLNLSGQSKFKTHCPVWFPFSPLSSTPLPARRYGFA